MNSTWQTTLTWDNAKKRAKLLAKIRQFFSARDVVEVETPALSQGTVTDVNLDALTSQYNFLADSPISESDTLYLQTSPEFHMKRLLASGYGCIYQIAKAFRHEAYGNHHNPEFTMLEWYRIGFNQFDLMYEVDDLLQATIDSTEAQFTSYQDIFIQCVDIDPLSASYEALALFIIEQKKAAEWLFESGDKDLLLQFIFSEIIEPKIGQQAPQFIYNFPVAQASLAKISEDDSRVAERFECYYQGVELANGFNELTDATEQQKRFEEDNLKRKQKGLSQRTIDDNFIDALKHGLPQCSGVALGIDRLVMIALNVNNIQDIQSFSIDRC